MMCAGIIFTPQEIADESIFIDILAGPAEMCGHGKSHINNSNRFSPVLYKPIYFHVVA